MNKISKILTLKDEIEYFMYSYMLFITKNKSKIVLKVIILY